MVLLSCSWAEPSAFSAGDLTVDEPYGLSENEKLLLKNIDTVKHLNRDKNLLTSEVDTLNNRIDGVQSVVDGLSANHQKSMVLIKKILISVDELENQSITQKRAIDGLEQNNSALKGVLVELKTLQEKNFLALETVVKRIDAEYISKNTFQALQKEITQLRAMIVAEFEKLNSAKISPQTTPAELFKNGNKLFKEKKYDEAISAFESAIREHYKPATSHFYLGEAYFAKGVYDQAIANYKESYNRYKKGSYNPLLFLHMAISLHKTGAVDKAQKFVEILEAQYPKSSEFTQAQKYFSKK